MYKTAILTKKTVHVSTVTSLENLLPYVLMTYGQCMYYTIDVLRKYEEMHEMILPRLTSCYDIMSSPQGKSSFIWIIGEFGEVRDIIVDSIHFVICTCISIYKLL